MFLRSFLIAVLCAALLGTTSACLTESQITSIFKKYNSAGKKKWAKATNAKKCDAAIKYSMKNLMREVGPDNAGAYVQLVEESIEALEKNDGNMEKAYTWYTTKCRAEWKKAEKTLGYPDLKKSPFQKCVMKNRGLEDYSASMKQGLKYIRALLADTSVLPSLLVALMKVEALQPMMSLASTALCQ